MGWSDPHIGWVESMYAKLETVTGSGRPFNMLTLFLAQSHCDDVCRVVFSGGEQMLEPFTAIAAAINAAFPASEAKS